MVKINKLHIHALFIAKGLIWPLIHIIKMFSLRNVATKFAFRGANALKVAKPMMMFAPTAQRSFSDYSAIQNGADKLIKALNKEITYE
jgi:hypothetical protein